MTETERDAHVQAANKVFRDCGFTLAPETFRAPFAWGYFPNAYMRDNWREYY